MKRSMLVKLATCAAILSLCGCINMRDVTLPDGSAGVLIKCKGGNMTEADCEAAAGDKCPRGYDMLNAGEVEQQYAVWTGHFLSAGAIPTYTVTVRCHA
jgi:hypothetical protein